MVSKSRKQRQVKRAKRISGNTEPTPISTGKSIHLKKVRPNMKGKMKIRLGHQSADIYEGFENSKQVNWSCPTCGTVCRVVGFCVKCEAGKVGGRSRAGGGASASSHTLAKSIRQQLTEQARAQGKNLLQASGSRKQKVAKAAQ